MKALLTGGPVEATPVVVVAGTGSGVGKTSVTLGLIAALRASGLAVQTFKVGPDYLDPTWLSAASGRITYNLDSWMTSRQYVLDCFADQAQDADIAVVEGVMGLFDGAAPDALTGSTAEIAAWLGAPVLLVIDAGGAARSAAAMVHGFADFERAAGCRIAGVIANYCGSQGHADLIARALAAAGLPGLYGWYAKDSLPALPERHLGLHAAHTNAHSAALIEQLREVSATRLDLSGICDLARRAEPRPAAESVATSNSQAPRPTGQSVVHAVGRGTPARPRARIGVARDQAFYFYYPDNLAALTQAGAELVEFSPLRDQALPEVDALYLGGGYPEEFAEALSQNRPMHAAVRAFAAGGRAIYAECGGLMYLSRELIGRDGVSRPLTGVLPFVTRMLPKRKMLGYVETTITESSLLGPVGTVLRGHEFHYSEIVDLPLDDRPLDWPDLRRVYRLQGRRGAGIRREGFCNPDGNVLASYAHQHFGSNPDVARYFLQNIAAHAGVVGTRPGR